MCVLALAIYRFFQYKISICKARKSDEVWKAYIKDYLKNSHRAHKMIMIYHTRQNN